MNSKSPYLKTDPEENNSEFLSYLVENGGPELQDYDKFTSIVNSLHNDEVDDFRVKSPG